jgi:WW domain-containing oxidoreductase
LEDDNSMALVDIFKPAGPWGFKASNTAGEVVSGVDLSGKTYLITGVNSGLGLESAKALAGRGARIVGLARSLQKARDAINSLPGEEHVPIECELSEPSSVIDAGQGLVQDGLQFHGLLFNAGVMALPLLDVSHGLEMQFLVNHVGHFILASYAVGQVVEGGRVVVLSSAAHHRTYKGGIDFERLAGGRNYSPFKAYGQSKLSNLLFARELARRSGDRLDVFAVHPGVIPTNLMRTLGRGVETAMKVTVPLFFKTIPQGAATQCFVLTHPDLVGMSGAYFADCKVRKSSHWGRDVELGERLWDFTQVWLDEWRGA